MKSWRPIDLAVLILVGAIAILLIIYGASQINYKQQISELRAKLADHTTMFDAKHDDDGC